FSRQISELSFECRRAGLQTDKEVSIPYACSGGMQRKILFTEVWCSVHVWRTHEPSVIVVRPGVIGTLDHPAEAARFFGAHARATVPADIEKGPDVVITAPNNDHTVAGNLARKIRAANRNLLEPADANPHVAVERITLAFEDVRVRVVLRWQRECHCR